MRKPFTFSDSLEEGRITWGSLPSPAGSSYGFFMVFGPCGEMLKIVSSGADHKDDTISQGWEHVSVSCRRRCPNWIEMSFVKNLFWEPEECVVQFHPPESQYINNHRFVLHLWRNRNFEFQLPPQHMIGLPELNLAGK